MNAAINCSRFTGIATAGKCAPVSGAMRLALYNVLNELPVAIFGLITAAYVVSSLLMLAR